MTTATARRFALVAGIVVLLVGVAAPIPASQEIADAEGLACTVCHDKPGSKLYTDKGKYYETMGTVEGFDEILDAFASCTSCHVRKPGSERLTAQGRRFARVMGDMEALRQWVVLNHPKPEADGETPDPTPDAEPPPELQPAHEPALDH